MTSRHKRSPLEEEKIKLVPGFWIAMSCTRSHGATYKIAWGEEQELGILRAGELFHGQKGNR